MRVGFDAHMVGARETGNETYALGLLYGFDCVGLPVDAYSLGSLPQSIHRVHRIWPAQPIVRIPVATPLRAVRDHLDLYHATYVLPPWLPCPGIVTIHDISYALHPEWFPRRVVQMLDALVPLSIRRARAIITISQAAKRDLVEFYGLPPETIAVTHLAPRPSFLVRTPPQRRQPFLLYVGNVDPRKNVQTVVRALRILHDRGLDLPLMVAGKSGRCQREVEMLASQLRLDGAVRFLGYVPDTELSVLYASCSALVHPALHEGFGLTAVEAMAQGAPTIVSNVSSLPEVVGDSGILVPPTSSSAWADAIERVICDTQLRERMVSRGLARAATFTWERCAARTLEVYRDALRHPHSMH